MDTRIELTFSACHSFTVPTATFSTTKARMTPPEIQSDVPKETAIAKGLDNQHRCIPPRRFGTAPAMRTWRLLSYELSYMRSTDDNAQRSWH